MCILARLEARGCGLTAGEEQFLQRIDALARDLSRPGFRGKLTEVAALIKGYGVCGFIGICLRFLDRSEIFIDPVNKEALERIYMV